MQQVRSGQVREAYGAGGVGELGVCVGAAVATCLLRALLRSWLASVVAELYRRVQTVDAMVEIGQTAASAAQLHGTEHSTARAAVWAGQREWRRDDGRAKDTLGVNGHSGLLIGRTRLAVLLCGVCLLCCWSVFAL